MGDRVGTTFPPGWFSIRMWVPPDAAFKVPQGGDPGYASEGPFYSDIPFYFTASSQAQISGTLTGPSGKPVPGVQVNVTGTDDQGNPVSQQTFSGIDGNYKVALNPGNYTVTPVQPSNATQGQYVPTTCSGARSTHRGCAITLSAGDQAIADFKLGAATVTGVIVDEAGKAQQGVAVNLMGKNDQGEPVSQHTTTGEDGKYTFVPSPGTYTVSPVVPFQGQAEDYANGFKTTSCPGGTPGDGECRNMPVPTDVTATVDFVYGCGVEGVRLHNVEPMVDSKFGAIPYSTVTLIGKGFCPDMKVDFGNDLAETTVDTLKDPLAITEKGARAEVVVARLATTGTVTVISDGQNATLDNVPIDSFRNVNGLSFPNLPLLDEDPLVTAWSGVYFGQLEIDGQQVPVMGADPGAAVLPPVLSGHGFDRGGQVVLGNLTLAALHKRVGQTVEVSATGARQARLLIVGTATMPAFGGTGGAHMEMGSGAVLDYELVPLAQRNPFDQPQAGPNAILMRARAGTSMAAVQRSIDAIVVKLGGGPGGGAPLLGPQRPAEIIAYRNLGATPDLLGGALAAGAVIALGLTLAASVRRRRRDLALLNSLGFTNTQLAATIAWQSTVAVGTGTVAGVPLGIALGRWLWELFARAIDAVPDPSIPVLSVVLVAVGALLLANLVAAAPGRTAARTPANLALRTE